MHAIKTPPNYRGQKKINSADKEKRKREKRKRGDKKRYFESSPFSASSSFITYSQLQPYRATQSHLKLYYMEIRIKCELTNQIFSTIELELTVHASAIPATIYLRFKQLAAIAVIALATIHYRRHRPQLGFKPNKKNRAISGSSTRPTTTRNNNLLSKKLSDISKFVASINSWP